ncbi:MAG: hypothetical protein VR70_02310 [Rhodospirillaceae bacterium BRH_c57]|nr:MAG: hypothetical protein VR70_02310 [Rhodospirillaceae bacterium BRH_c57]
MPSLDVPAADAAFVQAAFDDTLALIEAVRDHIADGAVRYADVEITPTARMRASQDLSRLTNRATAAISLLLLFKALQDGQDVGVADIPAQVNSILDDIQRPSLALAGTGGDADAVPESLNILLLRGESIFERMPLVRARLLALLDQAPVLSPAHSS